MIKLLATPVFAALAVITSLQPLYLCAISGPFSFLGTMWFMYAVMAVVHVDPWLALLRRALYSPSRP